MVFSANYKHFHKLPRTKNFSSLRSTQLEFASAAASKLSVLNSRKNSSDARGDGLASDMIQLKREFNKREGGLVSEIEKLKAKIVTLGQGGEIDKDALKSSVERCEYNMAKNKELVDEVNEMREVIRVMKRQSNSEGAHISRLQVSERAL